VCPNLNRPVVRIKGLIYSETEQEGAFFYLNEIARGSKIPFDE